MARESVCIGTAKSEKRQKTLFFSGRYIQNSSKNLGYEDQNPNTYHFSVGAV